LTRLTPLVNLKLTTLDKEGVVKKLSAEIEIEASPDTVWAILIDFAAYPEWNPFALSLAGEARIGETLEVRLQPPGGKPMTFKPTVTGLEAGSYFEWLGRLGIRGVSDGRHQFRIEPTSSGTRLTQSEEFTGILVPLLSRFLEGGTRLGFEAMNQALKERAEGKSVRREQWGERSG
jgi:hypothetical protein